jgi:hypothetical protein
MKKLIKILAGIFVVVVVLAVLAVVFANKLVLQAVNEGGPVALGVPVSLQDADIRPFRGRMVLKGFHIGNPEGFKTPGLLDLGSIRVRLDLASLKSDTIVVKEIAINGLELTYEKGLLDSNLGTLIASLSAGEEGADQSPAEEQKPAPEKPGKKVVIEKLTIAESRMNFSVTGAAALTGGGAIPIPLPAITLTDLGKDQEGGLTLVQAIREALTAVAGASGTAIAGSAKLLGQGVEAVGEGALTAGKAVGEGAVDAGKAIGGAAADAGKAVGDALHNINPFKK